MNRILKNIIIAFLLLVIVPMTVSAVSFTALSGTKTGSVGNGNGYFDNELAKFGLSDARNIYVVCDGNPTYGCGNISIVEPISYAVGGSAAYKLIDKGSVTNLWNAEVLSDGRLWFTDTTGLKVRNSRDSTNIYYANQTGVGGYVTQVASSSTIRKFQELDGWVYFLDTGVIKRVDMDTLTVYTYISGITNTNGYSDFLVTKDTDDSVMILTTKVSATNVTIKKHQVGNVNQELLVTSQTCAAVTACSIDTFAESTDYVLLTEGQLGTAPWEIVLLKSDWSVYSAKKSSDGYNYFPTAYVPAMSATSNYGNGWALSSHSDVILYSWDTTTDIYDVVSFEQPGLGQVTYGESDYNYTTARITTPYEAYYNNSVVWADVVLDLNITDNWLTTPIFDDYADSIYYQVEMLNPSNMLFDEPFSFIPTCTEDYSIPIPGVDRVHECTYKMSFTFVPPSINWSEGVHTIRLVEVDSSTGSRAVLSYDQLTVSNESGTPSMYRKPAGTPGDISTGSAGAVAKIDSLVGLMGMGVNALSKLIFAGLVMVIMFVIGQNQTKTPFGGFVFACVAFVVFAAIQYIPTWAVIIVVMILALRNRIGGR